ncbi:MAG TPA: glycosyltransferase family 2 protein [Solirubrobacteraceae bacterium]|jgi:GT2 family glycosyltransferase
MSGQIDVVIVAFNRFDLTASCLRHLSAQTVAHRVTVVDNGSTDDTRERLRSDWPLVSVLDLPENRGFAEACNYGVRSCDHDVVVLLNNDVDCRPDFLQRLTAPLLADDGVGSVAALMLQPGEHQIDSLGMCADVTLAGFPRLQGLPAARATDTAPVLAGPAGTAAAYRRAAWNQVGGLDEAMFAYMEDFDLTLRLRAAGWRTAAAPDAVGVHLGSATHRHRSAWQRRHSAFGRGYLLRRYGLLRGPRAPRTLLTEAIVVAGDLVFSHDLVALRGRLTGWKAARGRARLPRPPADAIDSTIAFGDSLALRRGIYGRRAA